MSKIVTKGKTDPSHCEREWVMIVMATRKASENTNSTWTRTGPKITPPKKKQFCYHSLLQMQKEINKKITETRHKLLTVSFHNMLSYKYVCVAE